MELPEVTVLTPDKIGVCADCTPEGESVVPMIYQLTFEYGSRLCREIPGKCIWICESLDIIIDKCDFAFWTLDLVPYLPIEVTFDAFFKAAVTDRGTMKATGRNPPWSSGSRREIFGANDAACWKWTFDDILRGR